MDIKDEIITQIFLELLRHYHESVNVTHGYMPAEEVAHDLTKEAYLMAKIHVQTVQNLKEEE